MANKQNLAPVILEDVRIAFRNFSGKEGKYNAAGNRNFAVILPHEVAEQMEADGWSVKYLKPREDEDKPQPYIQVKVGYQGRPPRVVMITSRGRTTLDEDGVDILDWADINHVDLSLNPYHWEVQGKEGIKAYLKSIFVTINEDELDLKYADVPDSAASSMEYTDEEF